MRLYKTMQGNVCACNNDHLVCGVEVCVVGIYRGKCFVKVNEAKAEEECAACERNMLNGDFRGDVATADDGEGGTT